jgi:hypothetical protein
MQEQKIAKNRQQVIFTLADGSELEGEVFLSLYEVRRQGPQRVGELLNGEDVFLPVKTTAGTVHLNVANIIQASTPAATERHELMMLGKRYNVRVTTLHGKTIEGEIFVDLPQDRSRVSDYLNRPDRFFRVFVPGHIVYIAARFVLEVRD